MTQRSHQISVLAPLLRRPSFIGVSISPFVMVPLPPSWRIPLVSLTLVKRFPRVFCSPTKLNVEIPRYYAPLSSFRCFHFLSTSYGCRYRSQHRFTSPYFGTIPKPGEFVLQHPWCKPSLLFFGGIIRDLSPFNEMTDHLRVDTRRSNLASSFQQLSWRIFRQYLSHC